MVDIDQTEIISISPDDISITPDDVDRFAWLHEANSKIIKFLNFILEFFYDHGWEICIYGIIAIMMLCIINAYILLKNKKDIYNKGIYLIIGRERYLINIIVGLFIIILYMLALLISKSPWLNRDFHVSLISNLLSASILFMILYFAFEKMGIKITDIKHDARETCSGQEILMCLKHDKIKWGKFIKEASNIKIFVYYYGKWVNNNKDEFLEFFKNGGIMEIILLDNTDKNLISIVREHYFPNFTDEQLFEKVSHTITSLRSCVKESNNKKAKCIVKFYNKIQNFSYVIIDNKLMFLSVYEQYRKENVESQVFVYDISSNKILREYWVKTLDKIEKNSHVIEEIAA